MSLELTPRQHAQLLAGINPRRVSKDGKGYSHVEAYDIRAHLIRVFGFGGWSSDVVAMELVYETPTEGDKPRWSVCYRAQCRLTVQGTTYTEWACGDAANQPSRADAHDLALKTAESQALKRAAVNLGDNFGLSLYQRGATAPLVRVTLVAPPTEEEPPTAEAATSVDEHVTEVARENEVEEDNRERSAKPEREPKNKPAPKAAEHDVAMTDADQRVLDELDIVAEVVQETFPPEYDETEAAVGAVQEAMPGATVDEEATEALSEKEQAVADITALVIKARATTGDDALQLLKEALELAVKRGVRQHRLGNGETIGASLTAMMAKAAGK